MRHASFLEMSVRSWLKMINVSIQVRFNPSDQFFTWITFGVLSGFPSRPFNTALNLSINLQLPPQKRAWIYFLITQIPLSGRKSVVFEGQVEVVDDDDDMHDT